MKKAAIVSIGNELLSGQTVDTNSAWLCQRLVAMSIPVIGGYVVGDDVEMISEAIGLAGQKADLIFVTGGLGPTDDDLTREAMADFLGVGLELDHGLLLEIGAYFKRRNKQMSPTNRCQAYLPVGAESIPNEVGTAPGIMADYQGRSIYCMPGVPVEMKRMFEETVAEKIRPFGDGQAVVSGKLKCFGAGESAIAEMLGDRMGRDLNPLINCTVTGGVIALHVIASAVDVETASQMVAEGKGQLREILGELVFGEDDQTLAEVVGQELANRKLTIALAESCTGGLIGEMVTDRPGASEYFTHGWVTYSNDAKVSELGVDPATVEKYGAVSSQVAVEMAKGARRKADSDVAIAVTGIAGPGGGCEQKPVGLVYIAVDFGKTAIFSEETQVYERIFSHSRGHIRKMTAMTALNLVRLTMIR